MPDKKIVHSVADSLTRLKETRDSVASNVNTSDVKHHVDKLAKPGSPSGALKKAGVALIVSTPDPVTGVAGAALIATSFAVKRKDPTKLEDIAAETRKILRDINSLSL